MGARFANRLFRLSLLCLSNFVFVNAKFHLQILHNNDMHSRFEETDAYGGECSQTLSAAGKCFGGFARMKWAANKEMREAKERNISSIFINAGDTFQGTPYYSLFKWKMVQPLLDSLELNATTLGNHEFDDGVQNLVEFLEHVKTPVLVCNLNYSSDKRLLTPKLISSTVLRVDDKQIGLIGYLTPTTMSTSHTESLEIFDEIPLIRREARKLKTAGVKIIIAVGHSGFVKDKEIAEQISEISVVVGGHSHTLLYTPKNNAPSVEHAECEYPYMVKQLSGKTVPVVQAFCNTKYLGKVIVTFNEKGGVTAAKGNPILLDSSVGKDQLVNQMVQKWVTAVKLKPVVGYTRVFLQRADFSQHRYESNFGNLIADTILDYDVTVNNKSGTIVMVHQGGIRCDIDNEKNNGAITESDIITSLPFANLIMEVLTSGSTILAAMEHSAAADRFMKPYLHFSGLRVVYDMKKPVGKRVRSVFVLSRNCSVPVYEPLQLNKSYSVLVDDFVQRGADGYVMFQNQTIVRQLGIKYSDALKIYLEKQKVVYPALEGRITIVSSGSEIKISSYFVFFVILGSFYRSRILST